MEAPMAEGSGAGALPLDSSTCTYVMAPVLFVTSPKILVGCNQASTVLVRLQEDAVLHLAEGSLLHHRECHARSQTELAITIGKFLTGLAEAPAEGLLLLAIVQCIGHGVEAPPPRRATSRMPKAKKNVRISPLQRSRKGTSSS